MEDNFAAIYFWFIDWFEQFFNLMSWAFYLTFIEYIDFCMHYFLNSSSRSQSPSINSQGFLICMQKT